MIRGGRGQLRADFHIRRNYYEAIFGEYDKVKGSDKDPKARF